MKGWTHDAAKAAMDRIAGPKKAKQKLPLNRLVLSVPKPLQKDVERQPWIVIDSLVLSIPRLLPGLNGKDGLIRQHYHNAAKVKAQLLAQVKAKKSGTFGNARVRVICTRFYCGAAMDFDNAAASFKHLMDAIVKAGIIADDGPEIIDEWTVRQIRVEKRNLQKMQVEIIKI